MKVRFNRWYNAVLTALLTLLGYGCSSSSDDSDVEMYGVLASYYVIQGSVTDEAGNLVAIFTSSGYRKQKNTAISEL